jgi:hypothetical protein
MVSEIIEKRIMTGCTGSAGKDARLPVTQVLGVTNMNILEARKYLDELISAANKDCVNVNPLPFVLGACFIDYFCKMVEGKDRKRDGYKNFVRKYMKEVRREYATFKYLNGTQDLPDQMYHVFRCGIIHSFSLIPDKSIHKQPGRDHSIALCHKAEADKKGLNHLSHYSGPQNLDSALFVIEDFLDDLLAVNEFIYNKAVSDSTLREKIEGWLRVSPPITGGY